jgi:hypothetical protein
MLGYALGLAVFARVSAGEVFERDGHVFFGDIVALQRRQRTLLIWRQAHAQRTRVFIISLVVRQTLHMRTRLAEYLGSSMAAVCCSGGRKRV